MINLFLEIRKRNLNELRKINWSEKVVYGINHLKIMRECVRECVCVLVTNSLLYFLDEDIKISLK